jgi:pimeloyl-ACP methyl ester carboxylesterase
MLRAFADLPGRQVHYRHAGSGGVPLLMLHGSPGSGRQLEKLGDLLSPTRRALAPDRPGNGDSPVLPLAQPEIADYALADLDFLDALDIPLVDVYGSHTGANVAAELAIAAPTRVRRIILDGIGLFSQEQVVDYLAHYTPRMEPDLSGAYLTRAFQFCRDQVLYFPWFAPTAQNARGLGLPPPAALHALVLEVLKSLTTYHLGYDASFRYDPRARLPLITQPTLAICANDDPLNTYLPEALGLIPQVSTQPFVSLRDTESLARIIETFLP